MRDVIQPGRGGEMGSGRRNTGREIDSRRDVVLPENRCGGLRVNGAPCPLKGVIRIGKRVYCNRHA
jgi:hypothetical protein